MNIFGGLDTPTAGRVRVGDRDLLEMSRREQVTYRRREVGFVWQQTARNLLPYLTAQENVELPMALDGLPARERTARARHLLEQVGLSERLKHRPDRLSGGEQQRVAVAVAMANHPRLLLADEPTGEVDSHSAEQIFNVMRAFNREQNLTVIVVTHDLSVASRVDRVVGMRDGRTSIEILRRRDETGVTIGEDEYAILDRTGRLQLPQPYIEKLAMRDRARVRLKDDHIAVWPDREPRAESEPAEADEEAAR
jgi:ABC-type lipoprotein export system ATPase subunit